MAGTKSAEEQEQRALRFQQSRVWFQEGEGGGNPERIEKISPGSFIDEDELLLSLIRPCGRVQARVE